VITVETAFASDFWSFRHRLDKNEQSRVIEFVDKFQQDPTLPGISLERIGSVQRGIWSARITQDLRAILHRDGPRATLLYADHHDDAYGWADRRKVAPHPVTGTLQVVVTTEAAEQRVQQTPAAPSIPLLFAEHADDYLLSLGVPDSWLPLLRKLRAEDQLLGVLDDLPADVAERLFKLAGGELVAPPAPVPPDRPLTANPDALRTFYVPAHDAELFHLLSQPFEKWLVYLHPSQRRPVDRDANGPTKVSGSAGTGKTVVALHRARRHARAGERVLLTSFVTTLCRNIESGLRLLCTPDEQRAIQVRTIHSTALDLCHQAGLRPQPVLDKDLEELLGNAPPPFSTAFLLREWHDVLDAQGITTWDAYRSAPRRGRGTPLTVKERKSLWDVFEPAIAALQSGNKATWQTICRLAREALEQGRIQSPYDAVLVDEVQDLKPQDLRLAAALTAKNPGNLTLVGDTGQRIYPGGFSLRALGIDVRGRSHILHLNYRTSEQIRRAADRILASAADDMDEGHESRAGTRSVFAGPEPTLHGCFSAEEEAAWIAARCAELLDRGLKPAEIAVFARTNKQVQRIAEALQACGHKTAVLTNDSADRPLAIHLGSMHRAKGLEFRAVFAAGCSDYFLPMRSVLDRITDPADRDEASDRERNLLYVSMTRARELLHVSWPGRPSPFLAPLLGQQPDHDA
jgi:Txe/YoeB family toxin of Txe-Axe toxin-antitoxin module